MKPLEALAPSSRGGLMRGIDPLRSVRGLPFRIWGARFERATSAGMPGMADPPSASQRRVQSCPVDVGNFEDYA